MGGGGGVTASTSAAAAAAQLSGETHSVSRAKVEGAATSSVAGGPAPSSDMRDSHKSSSSDDGCPGRGAGGTSTSISSSLCGLE